MNGIAHLQEAAALDEYVPAPLRGALAAGVEPEHRQVTAAFVTVGVLLMMLLLDWFSTGTSGAFAEFASNMGMQRHLENFAKGIVDTRDLIFYLSTIALCLVLSVRALSSWKWR